jgi:hypothetical protein
VLTKETEAVLLPTLDQDLVSILSEVHITPAVVEKKLSKLRKNKACGPDGVHVNVLSQVLELAIPLSLLFNLSMCTGSIPQDWRDANITPLFKKGSRLAPNNYRPVSLTSQVVKLFERLILDCLLAHIDVNSIISCHQHGFQEKSSCITNLLECFNDWTESLDSGLGTDIIYLDFSKAFDTVPHERLLYKLSSVGIKGKVLKWLRCFLSNRRQRVVLRNGVSSWGQVISGVSQGSILGPILFLIYVNDIPDWVGSIAKLFADDTKVYTEIRSSSDCNFLQNDLNALVAWAKIWLLNFNASKCVVIRIKESIPYLYSIDDTALQVVSEQRDLGVLVSNDLKPAKHITSCVKKANQRSGLFKRCFTNLTSEKITILYCALIRPVLEYGSPVWNPALIKDISVLEKTQARFLRLGGVVDCETLELRRWRQDMTETFKYINNLYKSPASSLLEPASRQSRGHRHKLFKQHCKSTVRQNFFANRVVDSWNGLPATVAESASLSIFKKNLRSLPTE